MLAWIEITRTLTCVCLAAVASYMLAWIEIIRKTPAVMRMQVASYMLAWVEIDFIVQISLEV